MVRELGHGNRPGGGSVPAFHLPGYHAPPTVEGGTDGDFLETTPMDRADSNSKRVEAA